MTTAICGKLPVDLTIRVNGKRDITHEVGAYVSRCTLPVTRRISVVFRVLRLRTKEEQCVQGMRDTSETLPPVDVTRMGHTTETRAMPRKVPRHMG